jgi:hypoxanthine phosphoribosyltransferase
MRDAMTPFLTAPEIAALTSRLAQQLTQDYRGKDLILICPLKGSCIFIADLMRQLDMPVQVDFVQVSAIERGGTIRILKDISMNIAGKHVVIVEEIIDTGRTLSFLKTRLLASSPAKTRLMRYTSESRRTAAFSSSVRAAATLASCSRILPAAASVMPVIAALPGMSP